jgi:polyhydroxyalkanoate synthase subunit PhaC
VQAAETSAELIAQRGKVLLLHYPPARPTRYPHPVLIVTPLLVRPHILDLFPGLSFIEHLTNQSLDVFLIDFGSPDRLDRTRQFEDYLQDLDLALEDVLSLSSSPSATLVGYCLGGLFAVLYTASNPERVRNLVTLATPFDFSKAGPLYQWLQGFDVDRFVDAVGNVPGDWIRDQIRLFASATWPERNLRIRLDLLLHLWDGEFLKRQALLNQWLNDLLPFPGEAYRQFIKEFIQANKLLKRELSIAGRLIDPSLIICPVLVLAHTEDLLAPPDSAKAIVDLVTSADREFFEVSGGNVGHIDIVVGSEGPTVTWPKVRSWLQAGSG